MLDRSRNFDKRKAPSENYCSFPRRMDAVTLLRWVFGLAWEADL
jgi:hypothetical protein